MKLPKPTFSNLINLLLGLLAVYLLIQRAPAIIHHFHMQGAETPAFSVELLNGETYSPKTDNQKRALVFWATWCGPCDIELRRIQNMIEKGELDPSFIVAISSYEEISLLRQAAKERGYDFKVGADLSGQIAREFRVSGTPTIVLKEADGRIAWMTTGLSPTLGIRLKAFFN